MEADKLATTNVNVNMQAIIHNGNTNKSSFLQEKYKHTSKHVGEEKSETGTHCRLRSRNANTQYNAIIQFNTIRE